MWQLHPPLKTNGIIWACHSALLQVAELAAAAAEQQADVDAAPSGRRGGGGSADSGSEAMGTEDGEGDPLLQRAEAAELAAAAAGRRAAAAEAEVDKLKARG